jgi:predicted porin
MNKKLLTAAIGAALAAGPMLASTALADVKVGGHAQVEYYDIDTKTTGAAKSKGNGLVDNARGRIWVDASEDLGGGMKAFARFEFSVDTANSGQATGTGSNSGATAFDSTARTFDSRARKKIVGLSGGFGALKLGNNHAVYKRMGGVRWDPFNATVLEARGNGGQSGSADVSAVFVHNGFVPGSIKWESGKLLGNAVSAELMYAPKKTDTGTGDTSGGDDWQAGISFKPMQGLEIVAAVFENARQPSTTNKNQDGTKVGVRWSGGGHTLWYQWEEVDVPSTAFATTTATTVAGGAGITTAVVGDAEYNWLGYSFKFGNNLFVAQLGNGDMKASGVTKRDHEYANLGVIHSFSKNTSASVGWRETERKLGATKTDTDVWSLGLRVNF